MKLIIILLFSCVVHGQVVDRFARFPQCTPDPNEEHTSANAASDPNCNEADAITGWTDVGAGSVTSNAGALSGGAGNYHLRFNAVSGSGGERALYNFTAVVDNSYRVTARGQVVSGTVVGNPGWKNWEGVDASPFEVITATPSDLDETVVAASTTVGVKIQIGTSSDQVVGWDNLSIVDLGDLGFHSLHRFHYIEAKIKEWEKGIIGFNVRLSAKREDEELA